MEVSFLGAKKMKTNDFSVISATSLHEGGQLSVKMPQKGLISGGFEMWSA